MSRVKHTAMHNGALLTLHYRVRVKFCPSTRQAMLVRRRRRLSGERLNLRPNRYASHPALR